MEALILFVCIVVGLAFALPVITAVRIVRGVA